MPTMDGSRRVAARVRAVLIAAVVSVGVLAGSALGARPSFSEVPPFTIEKLQLIAGPIGAEYTASTLTGEVGQSVEYEIIVTNTGDSSLSFSPLVDPNCTGVSPAGVTELQPAESETFTCTELLSTPGTWSNQAEIEA